MSVSTPEVIRKAWGEEVVAAAAPWLEAIVHSIAVPRDEYRQVLSRLDVLEHDVADIKIALRQLDERLDRLNERFDQMYQHFEALFDRQQRHTEIRFDTMNQRLDHLEARFDERMGHLEARFDERLDHLGARFDERMGHLGARFDERLDKMNALLISQTRWMVGTLALFGTLITILLAVSRFAP
ncbi:MAG: hypothetical protein HY784_08180 [Chloroflexi bacterium]|nr:hypothetical protein [Chloroflexota bacterium]